MKRLVLAVAVLGLVACKKGEQANPPADTTTAPAGARSGGHVEGDA